MNWERIPKFSAIFLLSYKNNTILDIFQLKHPEFVNSLLCRRRTLLGRGVNKFDPAQNFQGPFDLLLNFKQSYSILSAY